MIGYTPHELELREHARTHPDDARFDDADRILKVARAAKGFPFPSVCRDRAVFFFLADPDAAETRKALYRAETVLRCALLAKFEPRRTQAGSTAHYILTAKLPSGMFIDLVTLAEHIDGQDERQDASELAGVAA
jgi:hypothetical protein